MFGPIISHTLVHLNDEAKIFFFFKKRMAATGRRGIVLGGLVVWLTGFRAVIVEILLFMRYVAVQGSWRTRSGLQLRGVSRAFEHFAGDVVVYWRIVEVSGRDTFARRNGAAVVECGIG
jgi:hypothetical protein